MKKKKVRTLEVDPHDTASVAAFKQAAEDYVQNLPDWGRSHLYTKPFYTVDEIPQAVQLEYLHDAAHIVKLFDLPGGCRILDVACGPGWLSEAFYRFGYRVTGIDISHDLLEIARERILSLPFPPLDRDPSWTRFLHVDIETESPPGPFAGIVLYDCLHHFIDARGALERLRSSLVPGGRLVIKEGAMPEPGGEGEAELLAETREYGTLEAPFDSDYLTSLLEEAGFGDVQRFVSLNEPLRQDRATRKKVKGFLRSDPPVNFFRCRENAESRLPPEWQAEVKILEGARHSGEAGSEELLLTLEVINTGREPWPSDGTLEPGNVCLGFRLVDPSGEVIEEHAGRTPLDHEIRPGERERIQVSYPLPQDPVAGCSLHCDLVLQGKLWFGDVGSQVAKQPL